MSSAGLLPSRRSRRRLKMSPAARSQFAVDDAGQGILVQARVVARLFGMRLLSLDADVLTTKPKWDSPTAAVVDEHRTVTRMSLPVNSNDVSHEVPTASLSDATNLLAESFAVLEGIQNHRH